MTEAEWLECEDPRMMERFLRDRASARKSRLFMVACCRRILDLLRQEGCRESVDWAERYADGLARAGDRIPVTERDVIRLTNGSIVIRLPDGNLRAADVQASSAWVAAKRIARSTARDSAGSAERSAQCAFLRDIFGNPFRPVPLDSTWLTWNDSTVVKMAQVIYDDRRFADLPILADALEEAGCIDADILAHCRGGGEHVRGCWVVDLLLGKQ